MATTRIWWHPDSKGSLEVTDLNAQLTATRELPYRDRSDAITLSGTRSLQLHRKGMRVQVELRDFSAVSSNGKADERAIFNLLEHLRDGKHIGLTTDTDKAWCSYLRKAPKRGATVLQTGGNTWWTAGTGTITSGEQLIIESANPVATREVVECAANAAATAQNVAVDGVDFGYDEDRVIWVRHRLFWPALYLPEDQLGRSLLTTTWRRNFTLEMELELDYHAMSVMQAFDYSPINLSTTNPNAFGKPSLQLAIEQRVAQIGGINESILSTAKDRARIVI